MLFIHFRLFLCSQVWRRQFRCWTTRYSPLLLCLYYAFLRTRTVRLNFRLLHLICVGFRLVCLTFSTIKIWCCIYMLVFVLSLLKNHSLFQRSMNETTKTTKAKRALVRCYFHSLLRVNHANLSHQQQKLTYSIYIYLMQRRGNRIWLWHRWKKIKKIKFALPLAKSIDFDSLNSTVNERILNNWTEQFQKKHKSEIKRFYSMRSEFYVAKT